MELLGWVACTWRRRWCFLPCLCCSCTCPAQGKPATLGLQKVRNVWSQRAWEGLFVLAAPIVTQIVSDISMYVHAYVFLYTSYMYMNMYMCICIRICVYVDILVYVYGHVNAYLYVCMYWLRLKPSRSEGPEPRCRKIVARWAFGAPEEGRWEVYPSPRVRRSSMSAHPDSVTTQSQPGQVEPAPASVTDEGDDDAAAATGVDVSSDEDSLSRAPTLPSGPSAVTPGHTQPHEAVFGEPSRPCCS